MLTNITLSGRDSSSPPRTTPSWSINAFRGWGRENIDNTHNRIYTQHKSLSEYRTPISSFRYPLICNYMYWYIIIGQGFFLQVLLSIPDPYWWNRKCTTWINTITIKEIFWNSSFVFWHTLKYLNWCCCWYPSQRKTNILYMYLEYHTSEY